MTDGDGNRESSAADPLPDVPDKLYFRIGEVARLLSLPASVLRFWEGEFPHLRPYKGTTGQRLYRRKDVEALREVRHLLYEQGYTIAGARQRLADRPTQSPAGVDQHSVAIKESANDPAAADALRQVYLELRNLSQLLGRLPEAVPASRGQNLQLAPRKRPGQHQGLPLPFEGADGNEP